jgi:hypothetical protein
MAWLEQYIRRYEHARWTRDNNRKVWPFEWGLEHIGGRADEPDPRAWLARYAAEASAGSDDWYAAAPADDYRLGNGHLTFTSAVRSPWAENNTVHGRFFPAKTTGPAVIVLPNWNAQPDSFMDICRWLNALGISALRLSLPYHDRRMVPGHERADQLVGPNIGLTIQANRQAVLDVRRALTWLEMQGYGRLGILGVSIGSSIAFITMCHDRRLRAGAFLHVSTYFGDVVRTGLTTMHVWESLQSKVTPGEIQRYWMPISPYPYISRLSGTGQKVLMVSGRYDPTFWPEFTDQTLEYLRNDGIAYESLQLPCGHYSLGEAPFKWLVGGRFGAFLFQNLT